VALLLGSDAKRRRDQCTSICGRGNGTAPSRRQAIVISQVDRPAGTVSATFEISAQRCRFGFGSATPRTKTGSSSARQIEPGAQASIDPNLRFPFSDEYVAGVERQLPWTLSARVPFIARDFKDSAVFTDPAKIWYPVQQTDPGPDGSLETLVQTIVSKRYAQRIETQASYTWSRTIGSFNNAFGANAANNDLGAGGVFSNPNGRINTDGRTPQDFTHDAKVLETYDFPKWGGFNVSRYCRYQSGRPWARSVFFGPETEGVRVYVEPVVRGN